MNDNDIINALGYCFAVGDCEHCIYADKPCQELMADALGLINRQKAEIEALKLINSTYEAETDTIRNIAIKEFAERLEADLGDVFMVNHPCVSAIIDNLVKEMTEEKE